MISTLQQIGAASAVLGLSPWLRTDLILAATLLFLVFASWAMLMMAQTSLHRQHVGPPPDRDPAAADSTESSPDNSRRHSRLGPRFGAFGIILGLLGSLALLVVCAW